MELVSVTYRKEDLDNGYSHLTYLPYRAIDVGVTESEDELWVTYTLYDKGEVPLPMGHC